jgi:hypothetical protein
MIEALLLLLSAQSAPADEAMQELPEFIQDQTRIESAFKVSEFCQLAFERTDDQSKFQNFGKALIALQTENKYSNLKSLALSRDCAVWFLGRTAGAIDTATASLADQESKK